MYDDLILLSSYAYSTTLYDDVIILLSYYAYLTTCMMMW